MGGFVILPKSCEYKKNILDGFNKRGYQTMVRTKNLKFDIFYYPKYNGVNQYIKDEDNNVLFVYGTLWFKNRSFQKIKDELLGELFTKKINQEDLSGTFTLVYFNKKDSRIKIIHDNNAVNRIYFDNSTKIISSSWLSLVWLKERTVYDINKKAVLENLILGFNIGDKTFVNDIVRIKTADGIPKGIDYKRVEVKDVDHIESENLSSSIDLSIGKVKKNLNSKLKDYNIVSLGVSGGHDSRLVLGALDKDYLDKRINLFTFFKPNDKDLEIAKLIANSLQKEIKIIKTKRPYTIKEQENVFNDAFLFFDGQCGTMLQYSKDDYTKKFRDKLLKDSNLHLSGVGGEIFRNYNHQSKTSLPWEFWLDHFFNAGKLQTITRNEVLIEDVVKELKSILDIDLKKISYKDRKRYYGDIFLSDWHGIRNTIENQYSNYYSPFTDVELINYSFQTINFHGSGGEYESEMIHRLSPKLADIVNEYGYDFSHFPNSIKIKNKIKCFIKTPAFSILRGIKSNSIRNVETTEFEMEILKYLKNVINSENLNLDILINLKKEQVLMVSYVLKKIIN